MNNLAALVSVIGAGMGGYAKGKGQYDDREQETKDRDQLRRLRELQIDDVTQAIADKNALRDAGSSMTVKQVAEPGEATVGPDGPVLATAPVYRASTADNANGQNFPTQEQAQAAATAGNTPAAIAQRQGAVLQRTNPVAAQQLRRETVQTDAAEQEIADRRFSRDLVTAAAKGPDALATMMSDSHADGEGGAVKFKPQISADGKSWQMQRVTDTGLVPYGPQFSNDEQGFATAAYMLDRTVTPAQRMAHHLQVKQVESQDQARKDASKQHADALAETIRHNKAVEGLTGEKISASAARGGKGGADDSSEPLTPPDFGKLSDDLVKEWAKQQGGGEMGGGKAPTSKEVAAKRIEIERELRTTWVSDQATAAVQRTLSASASDPESYAANYQRAVKLGFAPKELQAMGYAPPAQVPPSFNVTGDPAKFRAQLRTIQDPAERLAAVKAFDQRSGGQPTASSTPKATTAAIASQGVNGPDPLKGLSRQQIREKKAELQADIAKWKSKNDPNAQGVIDYNQALLDRIENGQY